MNYNSLINYAKDFGSDVLENESMASYTSFKIGGKTDLLINLPNERALIGVLKYIKVLNIPYFLIGAGCNLLICDEGFNGAILRLVDKFSEIKLFGKNIISCGAGVKLSKVCSFALKNSLSGLEFAWGIPASVGGAVYMNAGAYGGEIRDVLFACEHIDENLNQIYKENLENFGYRKSFYTNTKNIITKVYFKLKPSSYNEIKYKMDDFLQRRKTKQPLEFPNAGSIFKRPKDHFVGALINECGLCGKSIGGAQISTKHSGFIVNKKDAKCKDVINLIKLIQKEILDKKRIKLKLEIKILNKA